MSGSYRLVVGDDPARFATESKVEFHSAIQMSTIFGLGWTSRVDDVAAQQHSRWHVAQGAHAGKEKA